MVGAQQLIRGTEAAARWLTNRPSAPLDNGSSGRSRLEYGCGVITVGMTLREKVLEYFAGLPVATLRVVRQVEEGLHLPGNTLSGILTS